MYSTISSLGVVPGNLVAAPGRPVRGADNLGRPLLLVVVRKASEDLHAGAVLVVADDGNVNAKVLVGDLKGVALDLELLLRKTRVAVPDAQLALVAWVIAGIQTERCALKLDRANAAGDRLGPDLVGVSVDAVPAM